MKIIFVALFFIVSAQAFSKEKEQKSVAQVKETYLCTFNDASYSPGSEICMLKGLAEIRVMECILRVVAVETGSDASKG